MLFRSRLGVFYRALREYSWKAGPQPPIMARPAGAFIHFLEEPPPELIRQAPYYGLTENSFQLVEQDPLASLKDLPKEVYEAMTFRNGCVYCHSFRGIGSKSYHITAADNRPHGGLALPLESYPENVWKTFVFDQDEAAAKIGASLNVVHEEARQACMIWSWSRPRSSKRPASKTRQRFAAEKRAACSSCLAG